MKNKTLIRHAELSRSNIVIHSQPSLGMFEELSELGFGVLVFCETEHPDGNEQCSGQ